MSMLKGFSLLASAASVALVATATTPAQAGILEFLFGDAFQERPRYYERSAPLDVHVNPRRRAPRENQAVKPAEDRKRVMAKPIDPVKRPNWYLEDPTLRRGDIVVLKGQVLVFEGGGRGGATTKADFMSLDKSRLISKGEKSRIEKMADTSGPKEPVVTAANKEASLRAPE